MLTEHHVSYRYQTKSCRKN